MTSKLTGRVMKLERRTAPVDLEKWRNTPAELCPDWVLISRIVGRPVSPEAAEEIYEDEGFWRQIEALKSGIETRWHLSRLLTLLMVGDVGRESIQPE